MSGPMKRGLAGVGLDVRGEGDVKEHILMTVNDNIATSPNTAVMDMLEACIWCICSISHMLTGLLASAAEVPWRYSDHTKRLHSTARHELG